MSEGKKGLGHSTRSSAGSRKPGTGSRKVQPYLPFQLQPLATNSLQPRITRSQRAIDHLIDALAEAGVLESHPLGKRAEHFNIRAALAQRFNGLIRYLQVVVPVSSLQIFVLEERRRRQDNVGIVGSVGEKLLVDHGEQVGTLESANHFIVIRANRRGI